MKLRWMTSAALTLGLSTMVPAFARADRIGDRDFDHHDAGEVRVENRGRIEAPVQFSHEVVRDDHDRVIRHDRDFDAVCPTNQVPACVLNTAAREGNGRHIVWTRSIRHDGQLTYAVGMQRADKQDLFLRITPDGHLLSIERGAYRG